MAPASSPSSGSWSGKCTMPRDILDLDHYMRGPPSSTASQSRKCEELVVDAGGLRKPYSAVRRTNNSSEASLPRERTKRFSHDSGMSDDTYKKHRHRTHKRPYYPQSGHSRQKVCNALPERGSSRSTNSMRAFRQTCEKALLQQQEELSRVTQLFEKLTANAKPVANVRSDSISKIRDIDEIQKLAGAAPSNKKSEIQQSVKGENSKEVFAKKKHQKSRSSADTSEITSSSRTTTGNRKKDYRTGDCKTYKIIMSKLEELNRLFVVRGQSPLQRRVAPRLSSGDDVSVCDKIVATDFSPRVVTPRRFTPSVQRIKPVTPRVLVERAVGSEVSTNQMGSLRGSNRGSLRGSIRTLNQDSACCSGRGTATNVNTAYPSNSPYLVAGLEKKGHSRTSRSSVRNEFLSKSFIHKQFDLNDPIKLYAQAKNLQTMYATTQHRRSHSVDGSMRSRLADHDGGVSLCAVVRGYWKTFRGFLCCPDYTLGFNG